MPEIPGHEWMTLVACACNLALATLAVVRLGKSPLAWPLTLLCVAFFIENAADVAYHVAQVEAWRWIDQTAASLLWCSTWIREEAASLRPMSSTRPCVE